MDTLAAKRELRLECNGVSWSCMSGNLRLRLRVKVSSPKKLAGHRRLLLTG